MAETVPARFACDECGRSFRWKPELAGKRAKCACGKLLTVPATLAAEEPDILDIAEEPPKPSRPRVPLAPAQKPMDEPRPAAAPATVPYRNPSTDRDGPSIDKLLHMPRDVYLPAILAACGFIAVMVWSIIELQAGSTGVVIVSIYAGVTTVVKTAILIGVAFIVAPLAGVSFGGVWTAILKLAAIVIVADAAILWLDTAVEAAGGYGSTRSFGRRVSIRGILAIATYSCLLYYLFDMDRDDVGTVGVVMGVASRIVGFGIDLAIAALLGD